MQIILPYSRDSASAAMPVVCSCQPCSLLQISAIPATREKNPQPTHQRLETRKSLPNLLPSWIPLSCCLRRVTTTRWTRRQGRHPPGLHCAVQRAHAAVIWLRDSISRARSYTRRPALKSRREGAKEVQDNQIADIECTSVAFSLFSLFFAVLVYVCVCGVSIFS